jgi:hypothetical protein
MVMRPDTRYDVYRNNRIVSSNDTPDEWIKIFTDPTRVVRGPVAVCTLDGIEVTPAAAIEEMLLPVFAEDPQPCVSCGVLCLTLAGHYSHFQRMHPELHELMGRWAIVTGGNVASLHHNKSNRQFIRQLELWGWKKTGKKERGMIELALAVDNPADGNHVKRVYAQPEGAHSQNIAATYLTVFGAMAIDPDTFWNRTEQPIPEVTPTLTAKEDKVRQRGTSTMVLDFMIGQDRPLLGSFIAESLGLSSGAVANALNYLRSKGHVKWIKQGLWQAVEQHHVMENQDVNIGVATHDRDAPRQNGTTGPPAPLQAPPDPPPVVSAPTPTVAASEPLDVLLVDMRQPVRHEVTDDEIYEVLDLLVPQGFKAKHYPSVNAWVHATKDLINALREG